MQQIMNALGCQYLVSLWGMLIFFIQHEKRTIIFLLFLDSCLSRFIYSSPLFHGHLVPCCTFLIFFCFWLSIPISRIVLVLHLQLFKAYFEYSIYLFLWQYAFPINYAKFCCFLFTKKKHLLHNRHCPNIGDTYNNTHSQQPSRWELSSTF